MEWIIFKEEQGNISLIKLSEVYYFHKSHGAEEIFVSFLMSSTGRGLFHKAIVDRAMFNLYNSEFLFINDNFKDCDLWINLKNIIRIDELKDNENGFNYNIWFNQDIHITVKASLSEIMNCNEFEKITPFLMLSKLTQ